MEAGAAPPARNPFPQHRRPERRARPRMTRPSPRTPPDPPFVDVAPRASVGYGATEAPRGLLWHRYELDGEGTILDE